jgi:hypothetical protein
MTVPNSAPSRGTIPHPVANPERAPRCLRLVVGRRGTNQCQSERAPGFELCPHHIAEAARDYSEIVAEAARKYAEEFAREAEARRSA